MKSNSNQTFKKKKEEFRKHFPLKKNQPVGSHEYHSSGPSTTVPRFSNYKTEGRNSIKYYGCGTPGVVKSKCPKCTRANEMETAVNCMTLFNLNSNLYPTSMIVIKIFGEKIAVCADTGASHTIASEKMFKFLQEHDVTFTNKRISFMMADGIRQTIMVLSTVVDLYIEGEVIPTEFLVLPDAKGNKTLLGLDFLNAAGIVLDVQGGKWHFSGNPRGDSVQILQEDIRRYNTQRS
ncbi:retrovirus-related Pol polyprotein from transposon 297 [Trichonephila clavipes]|uniref:Retrovirus-related Pol polyprotein from transposon 297 n=1 Tax=Trichonephila clavipes TaxID=2585209 RepID=A0A8X6SBR8_TRICX|nr:retrovirus-related Pol polyprotein from transposon 297 [Trichonephila clavipes]